MIHCQNPAITDGYCDVHLERLDLIKESHEHVKQMQLRTREDEKETAIERDEETTTAFGQAEEFIE